MKIFTHKQRLDILDATLGLINAKTDEARDEWWFTLKELVLRPPVDPDDKEGSCECKPCETRPGGPIRVDQRHAQGGTGC